MNEEKFGEFLDVIKYRLLLLTSNDLDFSFPKWCRVMRIENIFRQTDRTCLFLQQFPSFKESPRNVAEFCLLNNPNSYMEFKDSSYENLKDYFENKKAKKERVMHSAYLTMGSCKVILNSLDDYFFIVERAIKNQLSCTDFHNDLLSVYGIGQFMAHQIIINLQLTNWIGYDDSYVKLGNGSSAGLKLLELPLKKESLSFLLDSIPESILSLTPKAISGGKECKWTLETIENCLCIFHKVNSFNTTGKSRRKYKIGSSNNATNKFFPIPMYV